MTVNEKKNNSLPRIVRLDDLTANQIAAGEVIERPVSAVKELVENAIDAGGSYIRVEVRGGGLELIRVADDGGGVDGGDLALAVERHATSKLRRIEDLDDLTTLGFRGEALASIASVASLEIVTRRKGEIQGHRLRVSGSEAGPETGLTGCPDGTQVTVEQLFYNTPARLKFMKSPGYEGGLIHDLMIQMALGYPHIGFRLENQGRLLFDTADVASTEDLTELFYGKDARQALIPVEAAVSQGRLNGWITAPPYSRGTRKGMHLFVNGRRISARELQWSVERAFEYVLPKGRFPLAVLHFRLPGSLLDVNVHPGKLEIRINDPDLNPSLTRALRTAVSGGQIMPDAGKLGAAAEGHDEESIREGRPAISRHGETSGYASRQGTPVRDWGLLFDITRDGESQLDGMIRGGELRENGGEGYASAPSGSVWSALEAKAQDPPAGQWGVQSHNQAMRAFAEGQGAENFRFGPQTAFRVAGQLHATFILAETAAGLLIADQHVAHERILYESYLAKASRKEAAQMLMQPLSVNLTTGEEEILVRHILLLNDLGLILERFGPRQYLIRSEPAGRPVDETMFKDLLESLGQEGKGADPDQARQALLVMSACKAAVKANTPLTEEEMTALLTGLRQTGHPMTCPHGRPILYLLPYRRLIQAFGRSS